MHLRFPSRHQESASAHDALQFLPNNLRFTALSSTLEYVTNTELHQLHLQLVELCQPAEPRSTRKTGVVAWLFDRRARRDAQAATLAAQTLLGSWDHLAPDARKLALAADFPDWASLINPLLEADPKAIEAVAAFYADADPSHSTDPDALLRLLTSDSRRAIALAESRILPQILAGVATPNAEIAKALQDHRPQTDSPPAVEPQSAEHAVQIALHTLDAYDQHELASIATAALLLLDRPANDPARKAVEPIGAILRSPDHPAFGVLRRALKRDRSPAARRIAWRALKPGPIAMAALDRISNPQNHLDHEAVLPLSFLLLNPARAEMLAGVKQRTNRSTPRGRSNPIRAAALAPLLPSAQTPLCAQATRGLASLLAKSDDRASADICARMLTTDDPRARLTAARFATDSQSIADFCLDPSPAVALVAALRRSAVGARGPSGNAEPPHRARLTRVLSRSPHVCVRRIAHEDLEQTTFLTASGRPSLRALTLAQRDPASLSDGLKLLLDSGDPRTRINAIRAACRLGVIDGWKSELATIIETTKQSQNAKPASVVAATAAAALGSIPERATLPLIHAALEHQDPRVRANAVESLERLCASIETDPTTRLTEIKQSPEHRARANAIRALVRLRLSDEPLAGASDDLGRMLTDDRVPHRLAAVWLAERLLCDPRREAGPNSPAWQAAARGVAALARDGTEPHVRARASRCARRLLAEVTRSNHAADPAIGTTAKRVRDMARRNATGRSTEAERAGVSA